ncbi:MAG: hypothetical protein AB9869_19440 [Verrucomicrobiia bacterium]
MKRVCCQAATRGHDNLSQPASHWRRAGGTACWLVPGITLVMIPKCPVCLASYVALATGFGLSLPVAAFLRMALLIACVLALALVAGGRVRRFLAAKKREPRDEYRQGGQRQVQRWFHSH